jgi:Pyrimidine dimer DNA glycosylase
LVLIQTFLPYSNFKKSAQVLDYRRLGKQRVEVLQILNVLKGGSEGWKNHPAVKMWKGYEESLIDYGIIVCDEWISRKYRDTCRQKIEAYQLTVPPNKLPPWLGDPNFHLAHQSNLIRKYAEYYQPIFGKDIPNDLPYIWPVK